MKKTASLKALLAGLNYDFFVGEMAKISLNASELFLLLVFSSKADKDKRQKKERAAKLANANFCPPRADCHLQVSLPWTDYQSVQHITALF